MEHPSTTNNVTESPPPEAQPNIRFTPNQLELGRSLTAVSPWFEVAVLINPNTSARQISTRMDPSRYASIADTFERACRDTYGEDFPILRLDATKEDALGAFEVTLTISKRVRYILFSKVRAQKFPTTKLLMARLARSLGIIPTPWPPPQSADIDESNVCFTVYVVVVDVHTGNTMVIQSAGKEDCGVSVDGPRFKITAEDDRWRVPVEVLEASPKECCCSVQSGRGMRVRCSAPGWQQLFPPPNSVVCVSNAGCRVVRVFVARTGKLRVQSKLLTSKRQPSIAVEVKETGAFKLGVLDVLSEGKTERNGWAQFAVCLHTSVTVNYVEAPGYVKTSPVMLQTKPLPAERHIPSHSMGSWLTHTDHSGVEYLHSEFRVQLPVLLPRRRWCTLRFASVRKGNRCICSGDGKGLPLTIQTEEIGEEGTRVWCSCSCSDRLEDHQTLRDVALTANAPIQIHMGNRWTRAIMVGRTGERRVRVKYGSPDELSDEEVFTSTVVSGDVVRQEPVYLMNDLGESVKNIVVRRNRPVYSKSKMETRVFLTGCNLRSSLKAGDLVFVGKDTKVGTISQVLSEESCVVFNKGILVELEHGAVLSTSEPVFQQELTRVSCVVSVIVLPSFGTANDGSCGPILAYVAMPQSIYGSSQRCSWIPDVPISGASDSASCCLMSLESFDARTRGIRTRRNSSHQAVSAEFFELLPFPPGETRFYGFLNGSYSVWARIGNEDRHCGNVEVSAKEPSTKLVFQTVPNEIEHAAAVFKETRTKQHQAAATIQQAWRRKMYEARSTKMARLLQRSVRQYLASYRRTKGAAAVDVQRLWRGYSNRSSLRGITDTGREDESRSTTEATPRQPESARTSASRKVEPLVASVTSPQQDKQHKSGRRELEDPVLTTSHVSGASTMKEEPKQIAGLSSDSYSNTDFEDDNYLVDDFDTEFEDVTSSDDKSQHDATPLRQTSRDSYTASIPQTQSISSDAQGTITTGLDSDGSEPTPHHATRSRIKPKKPQKKSHKKAKKSKKSKKHNRGSKGESSGSAQTSLANAPPLF